MPSGRFDEAFASWAISARDFETTGVPFTEMTPFFISRSSGLARGNDRQISSTLVRISLAAFSAELPPAHGVAAPPVCAPNGVDAVSPMTMRTSAISTPSSSATIWQIVVSTLCPCEPLADADEDLAGIVDANRHTVAHARRPGRTWFDKGADPTDRGNGPPGAPRPDVCGTHQGREFRAQPSRVSSAVMRS